jgi:hypothetical protein
MTAQTPEQEIATLKELLSFLYPAVIACSHMAFELSLEGGTTFVNLNGTAFPVTAEYTLAAAEAVEEFKAQ